MDKCAAYKLIHDGVLALARAERQGICIDVDYCVRKKVYLTKKIKRAENKIQSTELFKLLKKTYGSKVNINSNPQLSNVLYKKMKIEPLKLTKGGSGATDEDALRQLASGVPGLDFILEMRKLKKVRDTYLDSFIREAVDGKIHPFFHLHTVRTYRGSSSNPNFQNIPKRDEESMQVCRGAIMPRPGHQLLEVDFSKLEVMIAACYHKDPTMLKYLRDPKTDMHRDMSEQIFVLDGFDKSQPAHKRLRDATKNGFVFPQFYGDYYKNNAVSLCDWVELPVRGKWKEDMGILLPGDMPIASHFVRHGIKSFNNFVAHLQSIEDDFWNRRFPVYKQWKETWVRKYQRRGYFDLLTGFRCGGVLEKNEAINYPIQGSAFHCLLWCFIEIDKIQEAETWDTRQVGQIHDSTLNDTHPDELLHVAKTIRRVTTVDLPAAWPWIIVPLEVEADICEVDMPWSTKKPYILPEVR